VAKTQLVEVRCDRCKRKEYLKPDAKPKDNNLPAISLLLSLPGSPPVEVKFTDLCEPCQRTIANHVDQIIKAPKGMSPDRKAKKKDPPKDGKGPSPLPQPVVKQ
jgi:hypothetical protein